MMAIVVMSVAMAVASTELDRDRRRVVDVAAMAMAVVPSALAIADLLDGRRGGCAGLRDRHCGAWGGKCARHHHSGKNHKNTLHDQFPFLNSKSCLLSAPAKRKWIRRSSGS